MDSETTDKQLEKENREQSTAANIVRSKLEKIYQSEPNAKIELEEVKALEQKHKKLTKHQQYMEELTKSGRSLAEIQTSWHDYYQGLPDKEKHEVWQEFYAQHENKHKQHNVKQQQIQPEAITPPSKKVTKVKKELLEKVATQAKKSQKNPHKHSLAFGLGLGSLVVFIMMFGFFNERFITPFIRPSQNVSATPIIVDPNASGKAGPEPKIIIPKINVEAPVVYDEPSIEEKPVQKALERGVLHYATTPNPGEKGNAVIFGHSSGNILNSGKYKFAFLLLKSLDVNDTFIIQKDSKKYVYKVYNKYVVSPSDLSVLDPDPDKIATMTLITCDPPGSSVNRLIVKAEQIFPEPSKNKASSVDVSSQTQPEELAGNSPSLWQKIKDWF